MENTENLVSESREVIDSVPVESSIVVSQLNRNLNIFKNTENNAVIQNINSLAYNIQQSQNVHVGTVVNVKVPMRNLVVSHQIIQDEKDVYKKTPSIKEMMNCSDKLSTGFLDHICKHFGDRWRDVTVLLDIDQLHVERIKEDELFFKKGGTKEVVFQCLLYFFQENEEKNNVGWFTKFLWKYNFRSTLWRVKNKFKEFKEIENHLNLRTDFK